MKYGDILNYAIIIIAIVVVRQTNSSDDGGFIRIFVHLQLKSLPVALRVRGVERPR